MTTQNSLEIQSFKEVSSFQEHELALKNHRNYLRQERLDELFKRIFSSDQPWSQSQLTLNYDENIQHAIIIATIICLHSIHTSMLQHTLFDIKFQSISVLHKNHSSYFELNINPIDYENEQLKQISKYILEYIDIRVDRDYKCKQVTFVECNQNDEKSKVMINNRFGRKVITHYYYKISEFINIPIFKHILDVFIH